ncbi:hypothetical protein FA95DRAFT_1556041 [Auriscalpium vulgare]|uniref:Uncharacterized protein n=1 Tax=Auriscalpium vulgare TaxID=40419 RepID=A0ACB8S2L6_9AGAM|nr:hypothetical protein FA95DRAFT_1556041 [Auriscalpium vulgare]
MVIPCVTSAGFHFNTSLEQSRPFSAKHTCVGLEAGVPSRRLISKPSFSPIKNFASTKQLCTVISDALIAHTEAYTKADVLHRDVSSSTIKIDEHGRGLLVDWDLPMAVRAPSEFRAGTWQFISAAILFDPLEKEHGLPDDLESFCHVLVYNLVKHRPTKFSQLYAQIEFVFDNFVETHDGTIVGGRGKMNFFAGGELPPKGFKNSLPAPCVEAVEALRALFKPLYNDSEQDAPSPEDVQAIFYRSLSSNRDNDWFADDQSVYVRYAYPPHTRKSSSPSISSRSVCSQ